MIFSDDTAVDADVHKVQSRPSQETVRGTYIFLLLEVSNRYTWAKAVHISAQVNK